MDFVQEISASLHITSEIPQAFPDERVYPCSAVLSDKPFRSVN